MDIGKTLVDFGPHKEYNLCGADQGFAIVSSPQSMSERYIDNYLVLEIVLITIYNFW